MNAHAYAKINLGLHIVGKRTDGFHNIETVFHRINLFDEINIENSDDISIVCSNPSVPSDSSNHCWKAVEILRKKLGIVNGVAITILKNIPIGAGLGGGSSDAATVLKLLPQLWHIPIETSVLNAVALQIGSDVPYFLNDSTAYAEGRGELLTPMKLILPYWIVLINPNIHLSTPWAYAALSEQRRGNFPLRPRMLDSVKTDAIKAILSSGNDFEPVVFEAHVKIKKIKFQLIELGATHSLMSGSGSSVFGLFDNMVSALKAVEFFSKEHFVHLTEPNFFPN
ncbi:MAG: 4-(cytidine 5'-diphospho)-2-C-methyl-D-erythritol kinase [Bacteriovoracaceae bacterium]|nr:4-(cytidine 5'-diphospho)-2-C-methyl-D-erythritol kinase [Bacteroidota bacterium]